MKQLIYIIPLFTILVTSCTNKTNTPQCIIEESNIENYGTDKLSNTFSNIEFITLETNDDCLLGEIDVIKKRNGKYYIQSGRNALHVFDEKGNFIQKVGKLGEGPGEYPILSDFEADNKAIYLLSMQKLYVYNLDGQFQKVINLEENTRTIKRIPNGFLAFLSSAQGEDCLAYYNDEGNILKTALPKNNSLRLVRKVPWTEKGNGFYIFQKTQSNDLVCFDNNQKAFYQIHAMNDENAISFDELEQIEDPSQTSKILLDGFTNSQSQLMFAGMKQGNITIYVHDKEKAKNHAINLKDIKDDITFTNYKFIQTMGKCDSDDKDMLAFIETNVLKEAIEEKGIHEESAYKSLINTNDEHNPTIIAFKFK